MKRLFIAAIIIILICSVCIVTHSKLDKHYNQLNQRLEDCRLLFEDMRYSECTKNANSLEEYWIKAEKSLSYFVGRDRLENIGEQLALLRSGAMRKDNDGFYSALETIQVILNHLQNDESWGF